MALVSEIPFEKIVLGTRVRSLVTNNTGKIVSIDPRNPRSQMEDTVDIDWDDGKRSYGLYHLDSVERLMNMRPEKLGLFGVVMIMAEAPMVLKVLVVLVAEKTL